MCDFKSFYSEATYFSRKWKYKDVFLLGKTYGPQGYFLISKTSKAVPSLVYFFVWQVLLFNRLVLDVQDI